MSIQLVPLGVPCPSLYMLKGSAYMSSPSRIRTSLFSITRRIAIQVLFKLFKSACWATSHDGPRPTSMRIPVSHIHDSSPRAFGWLEESGGRSWFCWCFCLPWTRSFFFWIIDVMDAEMWMKRLPGHEASTLMLPGCPPRLDSVSKLGLSEFFPTPIACISSVAPERRVCLGL